MTDRQDPARIHRRMGRAPLLHFTEVAVGPAVIEEGEPTRRIPAAVLMPVVDWAGDLSVLLTRRTEHLHDHPGESLSGGRREPSDQSAIMTALRETEEEIGLARKHVEVLGELPHYHTGTGFEVTPVVALVNHLSNSSGIRSRLPRFSKCQLTFCSILRITTGTDWRFAAACASSGRCLSATISSGAPLPGCW